MAFDEVQFPAAISLVATGGPERRTDIVTLGSGFEERNALWLNSKRRYNVGYGLKKVDDLHDVLKFFEARNGRLYGFRFKDWSDYKSVAPNGTITALDQAIGTGDGADATFQLIKNYTSGARTWVRNIKKPVSGTIRVAVDGVEKTITTQWTVDLTTGIITFTGGNIPAMGEAVTAGFEFDVPSRFDTDFLSINLDNFINGQIPDIPIVEIFV